MTIRKTLKKFEALKEAVKRDGKVDWQETEVILDFISPYCRSGNRDFMELHRHLMQAREDNIIDKEESDVICNDLDLVAAHLARELKIEKVLAVAVLASLVGFLGWHLLKVLL